MGLSIYALLPALVWLLQGRGTSAQNLITSDSYFYGQSPPVYPSRRFLITVANYTILK
jgi:hypothetical protein